tara:strand:- start:293 stop:472 length:180 start_codon:yes stop_codon:yes gene_type:complete
MSFEKELKRVEKNIKKDIKYAEKWVYERRKFIIKLIWIIGIIGVLLFLSNMYLSSPGFG